MAKETEIDAWFDTALHIQNINLERAYCGLPPLSESEILKQQTEVQKWAVPSTCWDSPRKNPKRENVIHIRADESTEKRKITIKEKLSAIFRKSNQ